MGRYLQALKDGTYPQKTVPSAPTKPTKGTFVGFVGADHRGCTDQRRECSCQLEALRQRVERACDWQDLHAVVDDAQLAFVAGEIEAEDVDGLCEMAKQEAHALPETDPKRLCG